MRTENGPVLVIDDDRYFREIMVELLQEMGFPVSAAVNGLEGLKCMRTLSPSLVLLDQQMPVMSGAEFLACLPDTLGVDPCTPVVLMSGDHTARLRGIAGTLRKPFEMEALMGVLSRFVRRSQQCLALSA